jgi:hypothetical protein
MFDNKRLNKIYMIDDPRLFNKLFPEEKALKYHDAMHVHNLFNRNDRVIIFSGGSIYNKLLNKDYVDYDESYTITSNMEYIDDMYLLYNDTMYFSNYMETNDTLEVLEQNFMKSCIHASAKVEYGEDYKLSNKLIYENTLELIYNDDIKYHNQLLGKSKFVTNDNLWTTLKMEFNNVHDIYDKGIINNNFNVMDHQNPYDDSLTLSNDSQFNNIVKLKDTVNIIHEE